MCEFSENFLRSSRQDVGGKPIKNNSTNLFTTSSRYTICTRIKVRRRRQKRCDHRARYLHGTRRRERCTQVTLTKVKA